MSADDALVGALLRRRLIARIATVRRDGSPHITAVWFVWDGEAIVIASRSDRLMIRHLERDPRVNVVIDDAGPGFDVHGVRINGTAALVRGAAAARLNREVHERYVGDAGLGVETVGAYFADDDVAIVVTVDRVTTWDYRDSEPARVLRDRGIDPPALT